MSRFSSVLSALSDAIRTLLPIHLKLEDAWRVPEFDQLPEGHTVDQDCGWPSRVNVLFLVASLSHRLGPPRCPVSCCLPMCPPFFQSVRPAQLPTGICWVWLCSQVALDFSLQEVENGGIPQHENGSTLGGLPHAIACLQPLPHKYIGASDIQPPSLLPATPQSFLNKVCVLDISLYVSSLTCTVYVLWLFL